MPPPATWAALVADAMPRGRLVRLAEPGARIRDVRFQQLPRMPAADVVTLVVGLNDIARAGFDPAAVREDLGEAVRGLTAAGAEVVLGRLHDPTQLLPVPRMVARAVRRRVDAVNAAADELAGRDGVHVLDLAQVAALREPGGWSTDRIHPSRTGHQGMAAAAAQLLAHRYERLPSLLTPPGVPRGPSRRARTWWALRHGLPYLAGHLGDFGPPVLSAIAHRV